MAVRETSEDEDSPNGYHTFYINMDNIYLKLNSRQLKRPQI